MVWPFKRMHAAGHHVPLAAACDLSKAQSAESLIQKGKGFLGAPLPAGACSRRYYARANLHTMATLRLQTETQSISPEERSRHT